MLATARVGEASREATATAAIQRQRQPEHAGDAAVAAVTGVLMAAVIW